MSGLGFLVSVSFMLIMAGVFLLGISESRSRKK